MFSDPFEYIRENVNIIELAQYYGIEVNRNKKALCIFHQDHKPSMSFKYNRFRCWACNASGSSIDLVAQLFGVEPLQAVSKINTDFSLGIDLESNYKLDSKKIDKNKYSKELEKAWDDWCDRTYQEYAAIARRYCENQQKYKPLTEDDFKPEYLEALRQREVINYKLDVLLKGSLEEKLDLFRAENFKGVKIH